MANDNYTSTGVGFFGLLTILFIGLKLANVIDWSWWLVILPLFIPFLFFTAFILFSLLIFVITAIYNIIFWR